MRRLSDPATAGRTAKPLFSNTGGYGYRRYLAGTFKLSTCGGRLTWPLVVC